MTGRCIARIGAARNQRPDIARLDIDRHDVQLARGPRRSGCRRLATTTRPPGSASGYDTNMSAISRLSPPAAAHPPQRHRYPTRRGRPATNTISSRSVHVPPKGNGASHTTVTAPRPPACASADCRRRTRSGGRRARRTRCAVRRPGRSRRAAWARRRQPSRSRAECLPDPAPYRRWSSRQARPRATAGSNRVATANRREIAASSGRPAHSPTDAVVRARHSITPLTSSATIDAAASTFTAIGVDAGAAGVALGGRAIEQQRHITDIAQTLTRILLQAARPAAA